MAKHNMLLGYARGSVGDVTFSRVKGQQVARARNRQPNNPRTKSQMSQRTIFVSAVEFFRRGAQNLFQFAFENKKPTQSDYNAFMSENAKKGIFLMKDMVNNPNVPMVGNFTMSKGTLTRQLTYDTYTASFGAEMSFQGAQITTIAELSVELKKYGYSEGDIITFVRIAISDFTPSAAAPVVAGESAPKWVITQITIDSANTSVIPSSFTAKKNLTEEGGAEIGVLIDYDADGIAGAGVAAGCVIVSRKETDGLKVTNAELVGDTKWDQAIQFGQADAWKDAVLADWKSADEAILEGSLS